MIAPDISGTIKNTVHSLLPGSRIIIFGSRARGDFNKHSDYDVLVITKKTFPKKEKIDLITRIDVSLVKALRAPVDVLLDSEAETKEKSMLPGHIIKWAIREGIEI
jgi:predicted nucleotidyltransferase